MSISITIAITVNNLNARVHFRCAMQNYNIVNVCVCVCASIFRLSPVHFLSKPIDTKLLILIAPNDKEEEFHQK